MKVELEIPEEYEKLIGKIVKKIDWKEALPKLLATGLEEELKTLLAFERAKLIVAKSKLSDREILRLSEIVKKRVARRHGLL